MDFKEKEKKENKEINAQNEQKNEQQNVANQPVQQNPVNQAQPIQQQNNKDAKKEKDKKKSKKKDAKAIEQVKEEVIPEVKADSMEAAEGEYMDFLLKQKGFQNTSYKYKKFSVSNKPDLLRINSFMNNQLHEENYLDVSWSLTKKELQMIRDKRSKCWFFADSRANKLEKKLKKNRNFQIAAGMFAQHREILETAAQELKSGKESEFEKFGMRSSKEMYAEMTELLKQTYVKSQAKAAVKGFFGWKPDSEVNMAYVAKQATMSNIFCENKLKEFANLNIVANREIDKTVQARMLSYCKLGYNSNMVLYECMENKGHKMTAKLKEDAKRRASQFEMMQFFVENAHKPEFYEAGIVTWGQMFKEASEAADYAGAGNMAKGEKNAYYNALLSGILTNKIRQAKMKLNGWYELKDKTAEDAQIENAAKQGEKKEEKKEEGKQEEKKEEKKEEGKKDEKKAEKKKKGKEKPDPFGRTKEQIDFDAELSMAHNKLIGYGEERQKQQDAMKKQETSVWKAVWGCCNTMSESVDDDTKLADERWIRGVTHNDIDLMKDRLDDINNTVTNFVFSDEMMTDPESYLRGNLKEYLKLRGYFTAYEKLSDLSMFGETKKYSAIDNYFSQARGKYLWVFGDQQTRAIDKNRIAPWKAFQAFADRLLKQKGINPDNTGLVSGYATFDQWKDAQFKNEDEKKKELDKVVKTIKEKNALILKDQFRMNYAYVFGFEDEKGNIDIGFERKIREAFGKDVTSVDDTLKTLREMKPNLQGAIENMAGMLEYMTKYPVEEFPAMYKGLDVFDSKKETAASLMRKLEVWKLRYGSYTTFIDKYDAGDKNAKKLVEEGIAEKIDCQELLKRAEETAIAENAVKGGDYKTFRGVNRMREYVDTFKEYGYHKDYATATKFVADFKFTKEWDKPDFVYANIETYSRLILSIDTIENFGKEVVEESTPAYKNKLLSTIEFFKAYRRHMNHQLVQKYKINPEQMAYATDEMVEKAKAYLAPDQKKEPEHKRFKNIRNAFGLKCWQEDHAEDGFKMSDYVYDKKLIEFGRQELQRKDYEAKILEGKAEYIDYLRLLVIKTRQLNAKNLSEKQKEVFKGQIKNLAYRAYTCMANEKFSRPSNAIKSSDNEITNTVLMDYMYRDELKDDVDYLGILEKAYKSELTNKWQGDVERQNKQQESATNYHNSLGMKRERESSKFVDRKEAELISIDTDLRAKLVKELEKEIEKPENAEAKAKFEEIIADIKADNDHGRFAIFVMCNTKDKFIKKYGAGLSEKTKDLIRKVHVSSYYVGQLLFDSDEVRSADQKIEDLCKAFSTFEQIDKVREMEKSGKDKTDFEEYNRQKEKLTFMSDVEDDMNMANRQISESSLPTYYKLCNDADILSNFVNEHSFVNAEAEESLRKRIASLEEVNAVANRKERLAVSKSAKDLVFALSRKGQFKDGNSLSFAIDNLLRFRGVTLTQSTIENWKPGVGNLQKLDDKRMADLDKMAERLAKGDVEMGDYAGMITKVMPDVVIRQKKFASNKLTDENINNFKTTVIDALTKDKTPVALKMNGKYYTVTSYDEKTGEVKVEYQNEAARSIKLESLFNEASMKAPENATAEEKKKYNTGIEVTWLKDIQFAEDTIVHLKDYEGGKDGVGAHKKGDIEENYKIFSEEEKAKYRKLDPSSNKMFALEDLVHNSLFDPISTKVIKDASGNFIYFDNDGKAVIKDDKLAKYGKNIPMDALCIKEQGQDDVESDITIYPETYAETTKVKSKDISKLNEYLYKDNKSKVIYEASALALQAQRQSVPQIIENLKLEAVQRTFIAAQMEVDRLKDDKKKISNTEGFDLTCNMVNTGKEYEKYESTRKQMDESAKNAKNSRKPAITEIPTVKQEALDYGEKFKNALEEGKIEYAATLYPLALSRINSLNQVMGFKERWNFSDRISKKIMDKLYKQKYDVVRKNYIDAADKLGEYDAKMAKIDKKVGKLEANNVKGVAYKYTVQDLPEIFRVTDDPAIIKALLKSKVPLLSESRKELENRLAAIKKINGSKTRDEFSADVKSTVDTRVEATKQASSKNRKLLNTASETDLKILVEINNINNNLDALKKEVSVKEAILNGKDKKAKKTVDKKALAKQKKQIEELTKERDAKMEERKGLNEELANIPENEKKNVIEYKLQYDLSKLKKKHVAKLNGVADTAGTMLMLVTGKEVDSELLSAYRPAMDITKEMDDDCIKYRQALSNGRLNSLGDYADLTNSILNNTCLQQYEFDVRELRDKKRGNEAKMQLLAKVKQYITLSMQNSKSPIAIQNPGGGYKLIVGFTDKGDVMEDKVKFVDIGEGGHLYESDMYLEDLTAGINIKGTGDTISMFAFNDIEKGKNLLPSNGSIKYDAKTGEIAKVSGNEEGSAHRSHTVEFCNTQVEGLKIRSFFPNTIKGDKDAEESLEKVPVSDPEAIEALLINRKETPEEKRADEAALMSSIRHFAEGGSKMEIRDLPDNYRLTGNLEKLNYLISHHSDAFSAEAIKELRDRRDAIEEINMLKSQYKYTTTKTKEKQLEGDIHEVRLNIRYDGSNSKTAGSWSDAMSFLLSSRGLKVPAELLSKCNPDVNYHIKINTKDRFENDPKREMKNLENHVDILARVMQDVSLEVAEYDIDKNAEEEDTTREIKSYILGRMQEDGSSVVLKMPEDAEMYRNIVGVRGDSLIIRSSVGMDYEDVYQGNTYTDEYIEKTFGGQSLEYEMPISELAGKKFSLMSLSKSYDEKSMTNKRDAMVTLSKAMCKQDKYNDGAIGQMRMHHKDGNPQELQIGGKKTGIKVKTESWISRQYIVDHFDDADDMMDVEKKKAKKSKK